VQERKDAITFKAKPLTLVGSELQTGSPVPDFEVLDGNLEPVKPGRFKGKVLVIVSVPSLDTPVCDTEAKRFNQEAAKLGDDVSVVVVSMDLPFAQQRWCGAAGVGNVKTVSDHRQASFGKATGTLIKELRLLARAVFVVDKTGVVRYKQVVPELTEEPDYEAATAAVEKLLGGC
jgi:thiol peroxidase